MQNNIKPKILLSGQIVKDQNEGDSKIKHENKNNISLFEVTNFNLRHL